MTEQDYKGFLLVCAQDKQQFSYFGRKVQVVGWRTNIDMFGVRNVFELSCGSTVVFDEKHKVKG